YKDIKKENEKYEHYYKEQKCFDVSQFDQFLEAMKRPLPAVFRITGYKKYPDELAWQTDLNRGQIRKVPQLQNFHSFLIAESESGHITRQEAVSMIPPLLLDVRSHHKERKFHFEKHRRLGEMEPGQRDIFAQDAVSNTPSWLGIAGQRWSACVLCSLNPIEDEAVVAAAIQHCGGAVEVIDADLPGLKWSPGVSKWRVMDRDMNWYETHDEVPENKKKNLSYSMFPPGGQDVMEKMHLERCMRLLPHQQDTGGFFVAVLRKTKPLPWQKDEAKMETKSETNGSETKIQAPPRKKRKWEPGFKEDPFVFLSSKDEATSSQITSFFGLKDFPMDQVLTRTTSEKKKQLYFVSKLVKNIVETNIDHVKVINTGVRVFSRSANTQNDLECEFRLVQDVRENFYYYFNNFFYFFHYPLENSLIECIEPFMATRVVPIQIEDVKRFLLEEQPKYEDLSEQLREKLKDVAPGSMIYKYQPENDDADVACELLLCGWRGTFSSRLYMNNHERMHFLNMLGVPVPKHLLP
uniref:SAM-dependent MTase RsmB/NOP-type domain-containing protein n=1 Tax=Ciona savignyi TaxID=51511 RepID=H2YC24_CIOSA